MRQSYGVLHMQDACEIRRGQRFRGAGGSVVSAKHARKVVVLFRSLGWGRWELEDVGARFQRFFRKRERKRRTVRLLGTLSRLSYEELRCFGPCGITEITWFLLFTWLRNIREDIDVQSDRHRFLRWKIASLIGTY